MWILRVRYRRHSTSIFDKAPCFIGIKSAHCSCRLRSGLTKVLLKQDAILVDDEGHNSGIAVLRGIGNKRKSTDHLPIDHVVLCAAWSITCLLIENAEKVAMERHVRILLHGVSICGCECSQ